MSRLGLLRELTLARSPHVKAVTEEMLVGMSSLAHLDLQSGKKKETCLLPPNVEELCASGLTIFGGKRGKAKKGQPRHASQYTA